MADKLLIYRCCPRVLQEAQLITDVTHSDSVMNAKAGISEIVRALQTLILDAPPIVD